MFCTTIISGVDGGQPPSAYEQRWENYFRQLMAYKDKNGNCNVPLTQGKLGQWVKNQRDAHTRRGSKELLKERIKRLNGIGFVWKVRHEYVPWDERFDQLVKYKEDHGDCNVSQKYKANPQLGEWVQNTRKGYKNGKLPKKQIKRLQGIGFKWILRQGSRTDTVVVSDVEEENLSSTDLSDEGGETKDTFKSTTATRRRSRLKTFGKKKKKKAIKAKRVKPARSTKLSRGTKTYKLRSSKSKEDQDEEAEEDFSLHNDEEADDGGDFGGGGDSLDFNDNDCGDIPRSNDVNDESEALSKEIKQLKEDVKVLTEKCEKRGHIIELQKKKESLLEQKVDIFEKQKRLVLGANNDLQSSFFTKIELLKQQLGDAKAEVSTLQNRIKELEDKLAKTPKTRSRKRKRTASPESINSPSVLESIAGPDNVTVRV